MSKCIFVKFIIILNRTQIITKQINDKNTRYFSLKFKRKLFKRKYLHSVRDKQQQQFLSNKFFKKNNN